ncbi:hypothetical protein DPMN_143204 [Dreissena polymorpha]|uniref:Uncharacterized protein n=1 Tax=Dreissena polymorpha TaxID=45954 RepID=A0A9D4JMZ2_DREPO|nr:hypothetical protein DPMN_143204 [Dreissena polymorpha]
MDLPEATMWDALDVGYFDLFAKCAISASGKTGDSEMEHPSVAIKMWFDIAKMTAVKIGFAAKSRQKGMIKNESACKVCFKENGR